MLRLNELSFVGSGLQRSEGVLRIAFGHLFTGDWQGGVAITALDGRMELITPPDEAWLKPNALH